MKKNHTNCCNNVNVKFNIPDIVLSDRRNITMYYDGSVYLYDPVHLAAGVALNENEITALVGAWLRKNDVVKTRECLGYVITCKSSDTPPEYAYVNIEEPYRSDGDFDVRWVDKNNARVFNTLEEARQYARWLRHTPNVAWASDVKVVSRWKNG